MSRYGISGWLSRVGRAVIYVGGFVAAYIFLVGMLVLVISDPILRYLVGKPFYWSNEVSTFMMIEMCLISIGVGFAKGKHVRVTLIFNRLPGKVQDVLWIVASLITLFYSGLLMYAVTRLALSSLTFHALTPTAEIPFFPWQIIAGVGLVVFVVAMAMFTAQKVAAALSTKREIEEIEKKTPVTGAGF